MQQQTMVQTRSLLSLAAPQDASLLASWETHLLPLQQARLLSFWSERALLPGEDRLQLFLTHLDQAEVIVFLVSADLFASEECCRFMEHALQRHQAGTVKVIPLVVRSVSWRASPLGALACLPASDIPVTRWGDEDEGWHACVLDLQRLLDISLAQTPHPPRSKPDYSDRGKFLRLLRRDYQKDLDASLERLAWQELGLHEHPGAVLTRFSQRRPDQSEQALPTSTSILEVYDEAAESLLILGEPGAGKSTLLTTLGLHLVARAETDPGHPLPVLLPLSSWAEGRPALGDWLVEQIALRYSVPRHLGKRWVQQHRVLPLLDGLDEMEETARVQCIDALNAYRRATFSSLVVCSRTTEYQVASVRHRLALQQAVIVQPLTQEQIMHTVRQGGAALAALGEALAGSEELRDLARTPLMLSILILTYHGTTLPALPQQSKTLEQQVWKQYMERMMIEKGAERRGKGETLTKRYDPERTQSGLGWLARQMRQHNQTVFSGEYLQESWLPPPLLPRATWLAEVLPAMLLGAAASIFLWFLLSVGTNDAVSLNAASLCQTGLVGGFLGWCLCSKMRASQSHRPWWRQVLQSQARRLLSAGCLAFLYAACFGLYLNGSSYSILYFNGLPSSVSDWLRDGIISGSVLLVSGWLLQVMFSRGVSFTAATGSRPSSRWSRFSHWWQTASIRQTRWTIVTLGLFYVLSDVLSAGLNFGLGDGLGYGLIVGLSTGLSYGVVIFLLRTILDGNGKTLKLAEQISWTWRALFRLRHLRASLLVIMVLVCFFVLSYRLIFVLSPGLNIVQGVVLIFGLSAGLSIGLINGLSYWLLLGLYQGMTQKRLEDRDRRRFNQGLHRSLRNSLLLSILGAGLLVGISLLSSGLISGLSYVLSYGLSVGLNNVLSYGLSVGLNNGLSYGLSYGLLLFLCGWFVLWATIGGLTVLRHYIVRLLLARSRTFPLHARRFLDDAVARAFLKRQGGGYAFVHRRLLDYCADTADETAAREKKA